MEKGSPIFSIVIPTYNRHDLLRSAIASVQAQTFNDWECLICDDGSTDATHQYVQSLHNQDSRFRLLTGRRYGLPAGPRNRGIEAAKGEWIAFLDDDDLWHPRKLERQKEIIEDGHCDAVAGRSNEYSEGIKPPPFTENAVGQSSIQVKLADAMLLKEPCVFTPSVVVRRDILLRVGGFAESSAYRAVEDYDLWCRLLALPNFRWMMDDGPPLVLYRDGGNDSISAYRDILRPDVIRQKWAAIEAMSRHLIGSYEVLKPHRMEVAAELIRRADDTASRCGKVGWRALAAQSYGLSAAYALLFGQPLQAARRVRFALQCVPKTDDVISPPVPEAIHLLSKRAWSYIPVLARRRAMRISPLPIDGAGRWSCLALSNV
ncbi:MAG: glycosyltransferase family 2 protein [Pyrinomonadaceae bacterium]